MTPVAGHRAVAVVAVLALIAGAVFALQGLELLPSRVMYGRPEWIVIGSAMVVISAGVLLRLGTRR